MGLRDTPQAYDPLEFTFFPTLRLQNRCTCVAGALIVPPPRRPQKHQRALSGPAEPIRKG